MEFVLKTVTGNIYDYPKYYDLVYGSDWKAEYDFLLGCFEKHAAGPVKRVFEPACGTGRLLYRLAKRGLEGSGNDLNPNAVNYCNARAQRHGLPLQVEVGDMADFQLKKKADAAFNTINSFRHLNSERLALQHLKCMAAAVRGGGIYVLGLHLAPLEGETCDSEAWSASRGHLTVNTSIRLVERNYAKRYEEFEMISDIYTPTDSFRIEDKLHFRTYTSEQIVDLVSQVDGLEIEAIYDFHYDLNLPIELGPSTEDVILVLKRK